MHSDAYLRDIWLAKAEIWPPRTTLLFYMGLVLEFPLFTVHIKGRVDIHISIGVQKQSNLPKTAVLVSVWEETQMQVDPTVQNLELRTFLKSVFRIRLACKRR